jgi:carboxyl-terminal processing protease
MNMTMNNRLLVILLSIVLFLSQQPAGKIDQERILSRVLSEVLESWHYSGDKLDDEHSQRAFKLFVRNLDFSKSFLLQSDLQRLKEYETRIDDQIRAGSADLPQAGYRLLQDRVNQVKGFYREILDSGIDISSSGGSIELDGSKREFCRNSDDLRDWWRKRFSYLMLLQYADLQRQAGGKKDAPNAALKQKALQSVQHSSERLLEQMSRLKPDDVFAMYVNAVTMAFDPHSQYMPPRDKEDFDIDMSGKLEGIGALLGEDDGYVKVLEIIPGSPSWMKGQPKVGDLILKVAQGGEMAVDVVGMSVSDAARLVRGPKGTEVRLQLKKEDGRVVQLSLVRDVVRIQETYARSATLSVNSAPERFGYLYLPKFYHDFNESGGGRNAADDVRAELQKLNRLRVAGVILDLRNNGGGALDDAVRLSGLFIDKGPVVQVRDRQESARHIDDEESGTVFSGPLVVMVNRLSASASEIVAGALQDYGRAVIVGPGQTFGKGTVQVMLDLDRIARDAGKNVPPIGALTLTVQKYYRVSGVSTQYGGVTPTIQLPEVTTYGRTGERYLDYSLTGDSIAGLSFPRWAAGNVDLKRLQAESQARVRSSQIFRFIAARRDTLAARADNSRLSLDLAAYLREQKQLSKENDHWNTLLKENRHVKVQPVGAIPPASAEADRLREWYDDLSSDPYLEEALRVLASMSTPSYSSR